MKKTPNNRRSQEKCLDILINAYHWTEGTIIGFFAALLYDDEDDVI
jgi:hypothetical protein